MYPFISRYWLRNVVLGVLAFTVTIAGLALVLPRLQTIQALSWLSGTDTTQKLTNACVPAKDLKKEVFFVSCGGFF